MFNPKEGDLAWGRMPGFSYWPCFVTKCPTGEYKRKGHKGKVVYHVQFFDWNSQSGWVTSILQFDGLDQFRKIAGDKMSDKAYNPGKGTSKVKWENAAREAEKTMAISRQERSKQYRVTYGKEVQKQSVDVDRLLAKVVKKKLGKSVPTERKGRKAVGHSTGLEVGKDNKNENEQEHDRKKKNCETLSGKHKVSNKALQKQDTLPCEKITHVNEPNYKELEASVDQEEVAQSEETESLTKHEVEFLAQIAQFLRDNKINLEPNPPTKGDGNCWYRAAASQVILHKIPHKPSHHATLRQAVSNHLKSIPAQQKENLVGVVFNGKARGLSDLACRQRKLGQWVDNMGVMVMATAQYLGRDIHLYGYPSDTGCQSRQYSLTRIEGGGQADRHPPLTVFFHAHHYQTLQQPYAS